MVFSFKHFLFSPWLGSSKLTNCCLHPRLKTPPGVSDVLSSSKVHESQKPACWTISGEPFTIVYNCDWLSNIVIWSYSLLVLSCADVSRYYSVHGFTSKVQLVPPAGWPSDVLKWTKCRASWNSRKLLRTSDPQNIFVLWGSADNIGNIRVCVSDRIIALKKMNSGNDQCLYYVVQQWKRLCYFRCTSVEVTSYPVLNLRRRKKERNSSNSLILGMTWCTKGCSRSESLASKDINHNGKLSLAEIDKVPT